MAAKSSAAERIGHPKPGDRTGASATGSSRGAETFQLKTRGANRRGDGRAAPSILPTRISGGRTDDYWARRSWSPRAPWSRLIIRRCGWWPTRSERRWRSCVPRRARTSGCSAGETSSGVLNHDSLNGRSRERMAHDRNMPTLTDTSETRVPSALKERQTPLGLSLPETPDRDELRELGRPRPGFATLMAVDGLRAESREEAVVRS